jgi:hypothetical protein
LYGQQGYTQQQANPLSAVLRAQKVSFAKSKKRAMPLQSGIAWAVLHLWGFYKFLFFKTIAVKLLLQRYCCNTKGSFCTPNKIAISLLQTTTI